MKKKNFLLGILLFFALVFISAGVSFAFYSSTMKGKGKVVNIGTARVEVTYGDGNGSINITKANFGDLAKKSFTVTNTGTEDTSYSVNLDNVLNELTHKEALTYTLTSEDGINVHGVFPSKKISMVYSKKIKIGETHTYYFLLHYANKNYDQSEDMGKNFSAKISVEESSSSNIFADSQQGTLVYQIGQDYKYNNKLVTVPGKQGSGTKFSATENKEKVRTYTPTTNTVQVSNPDYYITFGDDWVREGTSYILKGNVTTGKYSEVYPQLAGKFIASNGLKPTEEESKSYTKVQSIVSATLNSYKRVTTANMFQIAIAEKANFSAENGMYDLTDNTMKGQVSLLFSKLKVGDYYLGAGVPSKVFVTKRQSVNKVIEKTPSSIKYITVSSEPVSFEESGIYSTDDNYGVSYYYRGSVINNYIEYGNMCWRIVRVTGNGNVRLILANEGKCENSNSESGYIFNYNKNLFSNFQTPFNIGNHDNSFIGYMYGTLDNSSVENSSFSHGTGEELNFYSDYKILDNGTYQLGGALLQGSIYDICRNATSCPAIENLYTCASPELNDSCGQMYQIRKPIGNYGAIGTLFTTSSKNIESATENKYDSKIKIFLDEWYKENLLDYSQNIVDEVFCSDRDVDNSESGFEKKKTFYASHNRLADLTNASPSLKCNNKNDAFSVKETNFSNGDLTYPIGLLTADEVAFAGGVFGPATTNYYLYENASKYSWWTMTPDKFDKTTYLSMVNDGGIASQSGLTSLGVRPVITITGNLIVSGNGTKTNPYKVVEHL